MVLVAQMDFVITKSVSYQVYAMGFEPITCLQDFLKYLRVNP